MSQGLKAQLKTLIAAKQYQAAIVLLEASDMADKKVYIARLQLRMKDEAKAEVEAKSPSGTVLTKKPLPGTPGASEKAKPGRLSNGRLLVIGGVTGILLMVAIPLFNTYRNRYVDRMATVCEDVYRDAWLLEDRYTFNQWWQGCKDAAAAAMNTYGEEIRYCFDSQGQTDKLFMECLVNQDVYISSRYLDAAPKE